MKRGASVREVVRRKPAAPAPKGSGAAITDYKLLKVLGRGSFGKVLLAERKKDKKVRYLAVPCVFCVLV